jgi:hypothetical protein
MCRLTVPLPALIRADLFGLYKTSNGTGCGKSGGSIGADFTNLRTAATRVLVNEIGQIAYGFQRRPTILAMLVAFPKDGRALPAFVGTAA